jgi:hypothetical protein
VQDGCCIIKNFTSVETVKKVNKEVRPYIEADKPWKVCHSTMNKRRCAHNLAGRFVSSRDKAVHKPGWKKPDCARQVDS